MQRSKSFSKGGNIIDRVIEIERYRVDPQTLKKMLAPKLCNEIRTHKQDQSEHPEELAPTPFDKLTGRNKPNSFLRFNVKDANTHLNYSPDKDKVMTKAAVLPVRR